MADLLNFDPNQVSNPENNLFGLPFTEEDARLVILPIPWEVTVSYRSGTARAPEHMMGASMQVDLYDREYPDCWREGIYMRPTDQKILTKSDYLRKEAELYINYISHDGKIEDNRFMMKILREINEGSTFLNEWVYQQTTDLLQRGKLVGLLGGDHSSPLGFYKAIADKYPEFGILQIDAHCDLREAFEGFKYSHASIMFNALEQIPQVKKLVQAGIRDYSDSEMMLIQSGNGRISTYFDQDIRNRIYEGEIWSGIADEIVQQLPPFVYISFDIDGLDPKLCPNTGTPVNGGFHVEEVFYLFKKIQQSGRKIIGFDLNEVGVSSNEWDENVGARVLFKLCNLIISSNR